MHMHTCTIQVVVELPQTQVRSQTSSKSHILGKSKTKEDTALKAQRKATMKAAKREREKSMREGKEKRKQKMDSMDEAKLREFLGNDINRLETENIVSFNIMCCCSQKGMITCTGTPKQAGMFRGDG